MSRLINWPPQRGFLISNRAIFASIIAGRSSGDGGPAERVPPGRLVKNSGNKSRLIIIRTVQNIRVLCAYTTSYTVVPGSCSTPDGRSVTLPVYLFIFVLFFFFTSLVATANGHRALHSGVMLHLTCRRRQHRRVKTKISIVFFFVSLSYSIPIITRRRW